MNIRAKSSVNRHSGSYVDPAGAVYQEGDSILRGIRHGFDEFYLDLMHKPPVEAMIGREIIDTRVEASGIEGYPLTLWHRKLEPVSYCYEWPAPMLRSAALATLDICLKLADHELVLQDALPGNIVYESTNPVFVDFTSIVLQDPHLLWTAYEQFCSFFLWPLALSSCGFSRVSRALLLDQINGVSLDTLVKMLPGRAVLRMPWLVGRLHFPRFSLALLRRLSNDRVLNNISSRLSPSPRARRMFFTSLRKNVAGIPLSTRKSRWAGYYSDIRTFLRPAEFNQKQAAVANILHEKRPKTVVDIGCNRGGYSILAARAGAEVTAFDADEDSVSMLYELAKEEHLRILPLMMDVLNPSPPCGWRTIEFAPAQQRFRSEMAMALAVVHHLAITQRQTFERIVPALADYADKWLLTEFVPLADSRSKELMTTNRRDMNWYTLEGFIASLQNVFREVQVFPSHPEGRSLLLCTR